MALDRRRRAREALRKPALLALEWIDRYGDRDGDGFVEYERRTPRGLVNQSWKDSGDSQRFADGTLAEPPIAPAEVQGYVYDAKIRTAEVARRMGRRGARGAARGRGGRSPQPLRGGVLARRTRRILRACLDAEKRPVDSLCSNMGHLLWSGIVRDERIDDVARQLLEPALWSGWGIRTMSVADAGYSR